MISIWKFIVFIIFFVFAIIVGISTTFETVFALEEAHLSSSLSLLLSTLDDNNDDMIISEEICPPYCSPPSPIQELPKEQAP